jgi:hypothetical protein
MIGLTPETNYFLAFPASACFSITSKLRDENLSSVLKFLRRQNVLKKLHKFYILSCFHLKAFLCAFILRLISQMAKTERNRGPML